MFFTYTIKFDGPIGNLPIDKRWKINVPALTCAIETQLVTPPGNWVVDVKLSNRTDKESGLEVRWNEIINSTTSCHISKCESCELKVSGGMNLVTFGVLLLEVRQIKRLTNVLDELAKDIEEGVTAALQYYVTMSSHTLSNVVVTSVPKCRAIARRSDEGN